MRAFILPILFIAGTIAVQAQPQKAVADKIIAVVGDRIILQSDIINAKDDAERNGNPLPEGSECMLIEQAMIFKLLAQQAEKDSLPVTDEDVQARLDQWFRYITGRPDTEMNPETIWRMLESGRKPLKEKMLADAMQERILSYVKITPSEVQAYFDRIPKANLPFLESELEIGQIVFYPNTDIELYHSIARLDTVRSKIIAGEINFNKAAAIYSNDDATRYSPFILNMDGSSNVPIDQLDKEMVVLISKMKPGEYSQPGSFTNEQGKKGVRIVYFKSRTEPHIINMRSDYSKISQLALEEKKTAALDKWYKSKISSYYIIVDNDTQDQCEEIRKYVSVEENN